MRFSFCFSNGHEFEVSHYWEVVCSNGAIIMSAALFFHSPQVWYRTRLFRKDVM